jgi:polyglutamine-binding protein 1
MDNSHEQPLPPGVGAWPPPPSIHPAKFQPNPQPYATPYGATPNNGSNHNAASYSAAAEPTMPFPNMDAGGAQSNQTAHEVSNHNDSAADIESAVQEAVLREQDIETQQVIQNQRQAKATIEPTQYGEDLLSNRRNPNALKVHSLLVFSFCGFFSFIYFS